MTITPRVLLIFAALAGFAGPAVAAQPVVVASKIDTEGSLLGSMIVALLGAHGIAVTDKVSLGPTKIVRDAILSGQIDIYPEYTGNGAFFFQRESDPAWKNAKAGYDLVKQLDGDKNKLVWLAPAPANNTWAIALRKDVAEKGKLATMTEFGKYVAGGGAVKLAASAEFVESPAALPAFQKAYGFTLKQDQLLSLSGGDTAVTIKAAAEGTSGVNAGMCYGTDGALAALGLVVMEDDKGVQPVYEPTPVIRQPVLESQPAIAEVLGPVFASLTLETLQSLNARIAVKGEPAKTVAADYLKSKGFLK